jgi:sec-independent protein translocase protein TatA
MFGLGVGELLIILLILVLLFGAAKLPKLARSIGEAGGELRKGFESGAHNKKTNDENKHNGDKTN